MGFVVLECWLEGFAVRCTGMQCTVTTVKLSTVLMARDDSPYSYLFDTLVRFV